MEMTWPWESFGSDKPLGSGRREDLPRFQDHVATEKEIPNKNLKKSKRKRKGQISGCYKPTPLTINLVLEIWLLREQV